MPKAKTEPLRRQAPPSETQRDYRQLHHRYRPLNGSGFWPGPETTLSPWQNAERAYKIRYDSRFTFDWVNRARSNALFWETLRPNSNPKPHRVFEQESAHGSCLTNFKQPTET
jgi:hypothetical protein